ncbi:ATP-dependent DNA helicase RecG [Candidatus Kaiserbacteria bacterium]|nr:ATP-dependent DNA helicase RecG [Candidatus Kaiserbacteria bacterium]
MQPDDPLSRYFRLNPLQERALKKLGLVSVRDILYHFPVRYDQGGADSSIGGLVPGTSATIFGTIGNLGTRRSWKRKIPVGEAVIADQSGRIKIMWFHQPYLAKKFTEGQFVKAVGIVGGSSEKPYLANPHVETADPAETGLFAVPKSREESAGKEAKKLFAVYPESRGVTSLWFRHALERLRQKGAYACLGDPLPAEVVARYNLPDIERALLYIHEPDTLAHAEAARKRFAFEEIFVIQVIRARERAENDALASFPVRGAETLTLRFLGSLDIKPTRAQKRAIADILADFGRPHPMARLLEGDVGSGKTLVAAASAYAVVNSRPPLKLASGEFGRTPDGVLAVRESGTLQVAYMAPTEILAAQHFQSFIEYFSAKGGSASGGKDISINIALITGSGCKKFPSKVKPGEATNISRAQLLKWVAGGEIAMVVGTHALIQKSVKFQHLAYTIVDEQHRFGTKQRRALARKSAGGREIPTEDLVRSEVSAAGRNFPPACADSAPHFLSMTATPIPRTLALTIYGDLDISVLDELPPGRAKITTKLVKPDGRTEVYEAVRRELAAGRQAYVICPRIEEPDPKKQNALQAKSAKAEAVRLKKEVFADKEVGLLHGAMKPAEKDAVMARFTKGDIDVLVATSVVEVGVNVPNATVILIEGAERFGLAQLHQLRGRVMRSSHPPLCFLLPETTSDLSLKRLRALEKSDDGFSLAEADLASRGAGDLYGNAQWGVSDLGMEALKNPRLIQAARTEAFDLVASDPSLSNYPALEARAKRASDKLHAE